ncbi:hypothetical protein CBL_20773 [Carabus blaptoides fortunei]
MLMGGKKRKTFIEWKSQVRKRPRVGKELSASEEKFLEAMGLVTVKDLTEVIELDQVIEVEPVEEKLAPEPGADNICQVEEGSGSVEEKRRNRKVSQELNKIKKKSRSGTDEVHTFLLECALSVPLPVLANVFHSKWCEDLDLVKKIRLLSCLIADTALDIQIERFWQVEDTQERRARTAEEQDTVERDKTGRFIVPILSKEHVEIGNAQEIALNRLYAIENRLKNGEELKIQYIQFMRVYDRMGHMSYIPPAERNTSEVCFIPHHPVITGDSLTNKDLEVMHIIFPHVKLKYCIQIA